MINNKEKEKAVGNSINRNYVKNPDMGLKDGGKHLYNGVTYIRSYIGGAAFDHEVKKFEDTEDAKMWKMWREDKPGYYKKYHNE